MVKVPKRITFVVILTDPSAASAKGSQCHEARPAVTDRVAIFHRATESPKVSRQSHPPERTRMLRRRKVGNNPAHEGKEGRPIQGVGAGRQVIKLIWGWAGVARPNLLLVVVVAVVVVYCSSSSIDRLQR